jgi:nucleoside-diphosphate-sugar epimerase
MNLFVTGGTGFIGSHFVELALQSGHDVTVLRRSSSVYQHIKDDNRPRWITSELDSVRPEDLENTDVFVHLASHSANPPYASLNDCLHWNLMAPLRLFETARMAGISRYVIAGTCFEYGLAGERYRYIPTNAPLEPTQTYPTSKAAASLAFLQWASEFGVSMRLLRIFQVYGPGELHTRLWPALQRAALAGEDFPMTKGEQIRDFIHVSDVARQFLNSCDDLQKANIETREVSHVGSGKPLSILEFSQQWWHEWGAKGRLLVGSLDYRKGEVMRFVPELGKPHMF